MLLQMRHLISGAASERRYQGGQSVWFARAREAGFGRRRVGSRPGEHMALRRPNQSDAVRESAVAAPVSAVRVRTLSPQPPSDAASVPVASQLRRTPRTGVPCPAGVENRRAEPALFLCGSPEQRTAWMSRFGSFATVTRLVYNRISSAKRGRQPLANR